MSVSLVVIYKYSEPMKDYKAEVEKGKKDEIKSMFSDIT